MFRFRNWEKNDARYHRAGKIRYHTTGFIEIKKPGFYFVYNQMYYHEGHAFEMAHYTFINHRKVLESLSSVVNTFKKHNTKFQAGVFNLTTGDYISVRGIVNRKYRMKPSSTYFGAVMLFPV